MRVPNALLWLSACALLHGCHAKAGPAAIAPRQGTEATTTSAASNTPTDTSSASTPNESPAARDPPIAESPPASSRLPFISTADARDPTSESSSTRSQPTDTDIIPSLTSAINGPLQTQSAPPSNADHGKADALPLQPKITPAMAIAGVFLVLAGLTYTLIGIKSKWVQIFLSSAFLTSLSVTVLIIYVMNPPVAPAVQGGYFVAACMTGVIFGAGSLVFKEVTEGLGCLLGGFCLSMWILALRPGGTLQSTGGKVILIAAFTVATYALSFSHYTQPYAIIGATSFAGATAAILGLDCFTRAGLKEFWLYIWSLNENIFPLNTNTYPITRGIRVELAMIVLIAFLGLISQLKLWKVVKERRERKKAIRLGDDRERDETEAAIGRRLEEGNGREREQWEAVYGGQDDLKRNTQKDSASGTEEDNSLRKDSSISVKEVIEAGTRRAETIELQETTSSLRHGGAIHLLGEATATTIKPVPEDKGESLTNATRQALSHSTACIDTHESAGDGPVNSHRAPPAIPSIAIDPTHSQPPMIAPLPFTVPSAEHLSRPMDGFAFNFAEPVSQPDQVNDLVHATHSRASSLDATIDDGPDEVDFSGRAQNYPSQSSERLIEAPDAPDGFLAGEGKLLQPEPARQASNGASSRPISLVLSVADDRDPEEFQRPTPVAAETKAIRPLSSTNHDHEAAEISTPSQPQVEGGHAQAFVPRPNQRSSLGELSSSGSLTQGALERTSGPLSSVMMSYRTNEWAKHISTANEPEFDEPEVVPEGLNEEVPAHLAERPTPIEVVRLQKDAATVLSPSSLSQPLQSPATVTAASAEVDRTFPGTSHGSSSPMPSGRTSSASSAQPDSLRTSKSQLRQESGSSTDLSRSTSATLSLPPVATRGLRSTSTPVLGQSRVASPIDENEETEFHRKSRALVSPLPSGGASLMARRDSLLKHRHSQLIMRNSPSPVESSHSQPAARSNSRLSLIEEAGSQSAGRPHNLEDMDPNPPLRSASRQSLPITYEEEEEMTLAQRRVLIQQQSLPLLAENLGSSPDGFDAHLPQSHSSGMISAQKRELMLASWRQSMRQDVALSAVPNETVASRRAEMIMQKQQSKMHRQHSEVSKIYQENAFDQAMRRGGMQELHREAMRRMQANANRAVS